MNYNPQSETVKFEDNDWDDSNRFDYENPFHLKWQSSLFSELSYGTAQGEKEDTNYSMTYSESYDYNNYYNSYATIDKDEIEYDHINATFGYTIGFYPNTRTSAKAEARITHQSYKGSFEEENISTDFDYNDFNGQLALSLNYYISPQVRLNCKTGIVYSDTESGRLQYYSLNQIYTSNKWFNYFEVNLQYSIF